PPDAVLPSAADRERPCRSQSDRCRRVGRHRRYPGRAKGLSYNGLAVHARFPAILAQPTIFYFSNLRFRHPETWQPQKTSRFFQGETVADVSLVSPSIDRTPV